MRFSIQHAESTGAENRAEFRAHGIRADARAAAGLGQSDCCPQEIINVYYWLRLSEGIKSPCQALPEECIFPPVTLFATTDRAPSLRDVPAAPRTLQDDFQDNLIAVHQVEHELGDAIFRIEQFCHQRPQRSRLHFQNGQAFVRLNALRDMDPRLAALEKERDQILANRAMLLAQHAALKFKLGVAR